MLIKFHSYFPSQKVSLFAEPPQPVGFRLQAKFVFDSVASSNAKAAGAAAAQTFAPTGVEY
jgi:hypothetical protein